MINYNFHCCIYKYNTVKSNNEKPTVQACFASPFSQSTSPDTFPKTLTFYSWLSGTWLDEKGPKNSCKFDESTIIELQKHFKKSGLIFNYKIDTAKNFGLSSVCKEVFNRISESETNKNIQNFENNLFYEFTLNIDDFISTDFFILTAHFIRWFYESDLYLYVEKALVEKRKNPKISILTLLIWTTTLAQPENYMSSASHFTFNSLIGQSFIYPIKRNDIENFYKKRFENKGSKFIENNAITSLCKFIISKKELYIKDKFSSNKISFTFEFKEYLKLTETYSKLTQNELKNIYE